MKTNPNDSAFSRPYSHDERPSGNYEGDRPEIFREQQGLTKREHFAAMAMQGLCANGYNPNTQMRQISSENIAHKSVEIADALITELNKEKP